MPRTSIPVQTIARLSGIANLTLTAGDSVNGHDFVNDGRTFLLIQNYDASIRTATVLSVADPRTGRTGDLALAVPVIAGAIAGSALAGPFPPHLFSQSTGKVNVDLNGATTVKVAAISFTPADGA